MHTIITTKKLIVACVICLVIGATVGFFAKPTNSPTNNTTNMVSRTILPLAKLPAGYRVDTQNSTFEFTAVTNLGTGCAPTLVDQSDVSSRQVICDTHISFQVSHLPDGVPIIQSLQNAGMQINCSYSDTFTSFGYHYSIPELCGKFLIVTYQSIDVNTQFCVINTSTLNVDSHIGCLFAPFIDHGEMFESVYSPAGKSEGYILFVYK